MGPGGAVGVEAGGPPLAASGNPPRMPTGARVAGWPVALALGAVIAGPEGEGFDDPINGEGSVAH